MFGWFPPSKFLANLENCETWTICKTIINFNIMVLIYTFLPLCWPWLTAWSNILLLHNFCWFFCAKFVLSPEVGIFNFYLRIKGILAHKWRFLSLRVSLGSNVVNMYNLSVKLTNKTNILGQNAAPFVPVLRM